MSDGDRHTILLDELKKYPAVLDLNQVADIIGVSRKTVDDMIKKDLIKAFALDPTKERKSYRVTKADLMAYITNNK